MRFSAAAVRKGRLGRFIAWKHLKKDQIDLHFVVLLHRGEPGGGPNPVCDFPASRSRIEAGQKPVGSICAQ
jgi:hypothetical protein